MNGPAGVARLERRRRRALRILVEVLDWRSLVMLAVVVTLCTIGVLVAQAVSSTDAALSTARATADTARDARAAATRRIDLTNRDLAAERDARTRATAAAAALYAQLCQLGERPVVAPPDPLEVAPCRVSAPRR